MTDEEEKAEEYADKLLSDPKYLFIFSKEEVKAFIIKVYLDSLKCCEIAYNKGLAEGKPKWHDLRKDPNDLPKEIEIFSIPVYVVSKQGNSDLAQYDHSRKLWNYKHTDEHILYDVIAWCELPKFKE